MNISPPWDLPKKTMKKLLLLDADVIIDLHALGMFTKILKTYNVYVTKTVLREAEYFRKEGKKYKINITESTTVINDVDISSLKNIQGESKEARLGIDPGEMESIAYLSNAEEDVLFCTCDKAAIKLISYMELEKKSISVEKAVKGAGHHEKNLYPRHFEKTFKECITEGKTLRIQCKNLT